METNQPIGTASYMQRMCCTPMVTILNLIISGFFPTSIMANGQTTTWYLEDHTVFNSGVTVSGSFDCSSTTKMYYNVNTTDANNTNFGNPSFTAAVPISATSDHSVASCDQTPSDQTEQTNMFFTFSQSLNASIATDGLICDGLRAGDHMPFNTPYYDNTSISSLICIPIGADAIVDWVWIGLWDITINISVLDGQSALLQHDDVVTLNGTNTMVDFTNGTTTFGTNKVLQLRNNFENYKYQLILNTN